MYEYVTSIIDECYLSVPSYDTCNLSGDNYFDFPDPNDNKDITETKNITNNEKDDIRTSGLFKWCYCIWF